MPHKIPQKVCIRKFYDKIQGLTEVTPLSVVGRVCKCVT